MELEPEVQAAQLQVPGAALDSAEGEGAVQLIGGILQDLTQVETRHRQTLQQENDYKKIQIIMNSIFYFMENIMFYMYV